MPQTSVLSSSRVASPYTAPTPFTCTWKEGGSGAAWVHIAGELDLATATKLRDALRDAQLNARVVVLDLRELTFMDSAGVHVVLDAAVDARQAGGRLILVRASAPVDRVFTLTGACEQVEIVDLDPAEPPVRALLHLDQAFGRSGARLASTTVEPVLSMDRMLLAESESERLAAVRRYDVLDTPPDGAFDRITALAATHFEVPIAIVSIVDSDRIWFKSHHGLDVQEIGRDPGLCASAIFQEQPWIVENAQADPRTMANPLVAGELGLRFYAGAPLRTHDGHGLGTLCVIDRDSREFSEEQAATLADMAAVVMDELELRLAARQIVDHELSLREQAEHLARTLQEGLLPPELPEIPGADIAAFYRPADAQVVGGDFYDVFEANGAWVLVVGDVSGKGPAAAAVTALARHTVRAALLSAASPAQALDTLNQAMFLGRQQTEIKHFCTLLVVLIRPAEDGFQLTVSGAAHPPGVIVSADGSTSLLQAVGPPVGWYPDAEFHERSASLQHGDLLALFTDGITEAHTPSGILGIEGVAHRLGEAAQGSGACEIMDVLKQLIAIEDIEVRDDVATLILKAL